MLKRTRISGWVAVCVTGALGCAPAPDRESAREQLMEADLAFAAETARLGGDGWANFFHENGVMFPMTGGRVDGQDAIRSHMVPAFGEGRPELRWTPGEAVVCGSNDLGYTLGRWESVGKGAAGQDSVLAVGNYVTIWRKVPGQGWRVAVDIGNEDTTP